MLPRRGTRAAVSKPRPRPAAVTLRRQLIGNRKTLYVSRWVQAVGQGQLCIHTGSELACTELQAR
jgi:hypothetical protein